jgi:hypothetical protein
MAQTTARQGAPEQIKSLYERHRKGTLVDETWNRIEADIFQAQHENRIAMRPYMTK